MAVRAVGTPVDAGRLVAVAAAEIPYQDLGTGPEAASEGGAAAPDRTAGAVSRRARLAHRVRVLGAISRGSEGLAGSAALRAPPGGPDGGRAGRVAGRVARSHRAACDDGGVPDKLAVVAAPGATTAETKTCGRSWCTLRRRRGSRSAGIDSQTRYGNRCPEVHD